MKNERKKGAVLSYMQVVASVLVNLIYVPVLLHFLGKSEYGLYQIAGSFFSYVTVFESSMSVGVLRNYCKALDLHDEKLQNDTLYCAKRIYRALALLIAAVGLLITIIFRLFYKSSFSPQELQEGSAILIILFCNMVITISGSVFLTIITAHEKFIFIKGLNLLTTCIQPFLVILCVSQWPYAVMIVVVMTVLNLLSVFIRYFYSTRKLKTRIVQSNSFKDRALVKSIIGLASTVLLASIADQIFWKTDQVILGKLYNTAVVAVYSVGSQIYMLYMQFGTAITQVYFPRLSSLYEEKNGIEKISHLFVSVGRIINFVILLILTGFIIFGKEFLYFWVGDGYEAAYYVAIVVMIPFSIDLAQNLGLPILQITGRYGFRAKMYFLGAVINILSTIIMSIYFGMIGAAISTGIAMLITSGFILNWYFYKKVGLNIKMFWKKSFPIICTAAVLTLLSLWIKSKFIIFSNSLPIFALEIVIYTIIYFIIMYLLVMDESEKNLVNTIFFNKLKKRNSDK